VTTALFGGSFNPPHAAHQMVCLYVLETHAVDRILMVPVYRHAFDKQLVDFEHRLEMCRLAAAAFAPGRVEVSRVEQELGGESRTLLTLERLEQTMPGEAFRLVVGADILGEAHKWYRWDEVTRRAPPIVIGRSGHPAVPGAELELPEISSTEIRARLGRGDDVAQLIPRSVGGYIRAHQLYRSSSAAPMAPPSRGAP